MSLKRLLQSLAMLDALMEPTWELRYYSFNATWSPSEQMGSMRNGSGDEFFTVFSDAGCFLKGFDHQSEMTPFRTKPPKLWHGVLDGVPSDFSSCLTEPAFSMEATTFCIWRRANDAAWKCGPITFPTGDDPDGSEHLLSMLDGEPTTYQTFAREYFEVELGLDAISSICRHEPLTRALVATDGFKGTWEMMIDEAREIGYPVNLG